MKPDLSVIIVSFNTRELTLKAIETLYSTTAGMNLQVILWDNASHDGSAEAVAERFPEVELVACEDNLGFAGGNNEASKLVTSDWLLLLNPDTETHENSIANLLRFAKDNPQAGIVGGRTVFPDGSLNPTSCANQMSLWSLFCSAVGLVRMFRSSSFFNPEAMGGWKRDTVRQVDIVSGCFFMLRTELWRELGGFRRKYWMYGEEVDLCLRAHKLGYKPMITPDAQIMHLVGASTKSAAEKHIKVKRAKATLIRDHWPTWKVPLGLAMFWLWAVCRRTASLILGVVFGKQDTREHWALVWHQRKSWMAGYKD